VKNAAMKAHNFYNPAFSNFHIPYK